MGAVEAQLRFRGAVNAGLRSDLCNGAPAFGARASSLLLEITIVFRTTAMDFQLDFDDEDWENDWDYDELISHAAGEIADGAQQCVAQPGRLQNLKKFALSSIQLLSASAFLKTASVDERSKVITEVNNAVSQTVVRVNLSLTAHGRIC